MSDAAQIPEKGKISPKQAGIAIGLSFAALGGVLLWTLKQPEMPIEKIIAKRASHIAVSMVGNQTYATIVASGNLYRCAYDIEGASLSDCDRLMVATRDFPAPALTPEEP